MPSDEATVGTAPFLPATVGGVKLKVRESDADRAAAVLAILAAEDTSQVVKKEAGAAQAFAYPTLGVELSLRNRS